MASGRLVAVGWGGARRAARGDSSTALALGQAWEGVGEAADGRGLSAAGWGRGRTNRASGEQKRDVIWGG